MMEFKCKYEKLDDEDLGGETYPEVTFVIGDDANLDSVLSAFENFLKACTYHFEGRHLEMVPDDYVAPSEEEPC